MGPFIHDDFLLENRTAPRLFERYAQAQPMDYYKWRAMRANGLDERCCTGDANPYEKFLAWAKTVPYTLRNPLYHSTHFCASASLS